MIIFLIRKRLKLKKYQCFRFENQNIKSCWYQITDEEVLKFQRINNHYRFIKKSNLSINFLLSNEALMFIERGEIYYGR